MNISTLFRILADNPTITDVGETTFIFPHGVVYLEQLDNGRVILSWQMCEESHLGEMNSIVLHNKGILKTSCKKETRDILSSFFNLPFEQLDKAWSSTSISAWLKEASNSDALYNEWLEQREEHGVVAFALEQKSAMRWHVYHNHYTEEPVLTIFPHEKSIIAHPCHKVWVKTARYLEDILKDASVYTDAMIIQNIRRYLSKYY